jgi:hypothetical protein
MTILPKAPKYSTCWFCHSKVEGSHTRETERQYSCRNHPVQIQWYCKRLTYGKWSFSKIEIFIPNHFKLSWNMHINNRFYLQEWEKVTTRIFGTWVLVFEPDNSKPKGFDVDWVLLQSPERLHSLLQLYQTFL